MRPPDSVISARLAATRAGRRPGLIRLTPLIDVVFILIVFFMLASSFQDWRAIELIAPDGSRTGVSMEGALWVEIRHDGLRLSGEPISLDALGARIKAHVAERPDQRVLVKPTSGIALQEAVHVLDVLAHVGITELSLIRDLDE